jgi:CheY-like chemotaxis protein
MSNSNSLSIDANSMFGRLLARIENIWQRLGQAAAERPGVLAMTLSPGSCNDLRIFAIEEGWKLRFANTLETAVQACQMSRVCVVLYDHDLPGMEWRKTFHSMLRAARPVSFILLSADVTSRLRKSVLDAGGFDLARKPLERCKPLEREAIVGLVNGALALAADIDSCTAASLAKRQPVGTAHGGTGPTRDQRFFDRQ